jgi:hypothetical protein
VVEGTGLCLSEDNFRDEFLDQSMETDYLCCSISIAAVPSVGHIRKSAGLIEVI